MIGSEVRVIAPSPMLSGKLGTVVETYAGDAYDWWVRIHEFSESSAYGFSTSELEVIDAG